MDKGKIEKVFLSINRTERSKDETRLLKTLQRAGFSFSSPVSKTTIKSGSLVAESGFNNGDNVDLEIQNSFCSIHFIEKKQGSYQWKI